MAAGLAHPHHGKPGGIGLRDRFKRLDRGGEASERLGIADLAARLAAMERVLIGMPVK
jgi:hypothetical protein